MLQLSLVCECRPLSGIGRLRSGIAALALSWAIGTGAYFLFVNLGHIPATERAAVGLRDPGGPIAAPDFGAALIAVGIWQAVIFIGLRGWPVNIITRRARRLVAGNALVVGLGALTYLVLREPVGWRPGAIGVAAGCVISAVLIVGMLFEGWPAVRLRPAPSPWCSSLWSPSRSTAPWPPTPTAYGGSEPAQTTGSPSPRSASSAPVPSCTSASDSAGHSA
jgi:hypothetical protein